MNASIQFTVKEEYSVCVENVTLLMLRARIGQEKSAALDTRPLALKPTDVLHTHAHAELFACASGCVHLQTANGILALQPGDIAVVPPGFLHCRLPITQSSRFCALDFVCTKKKRSDTANLMRDLSPLLQSGSLLIVRSCMSICEELIEIAEQEESATPYLPALRLITVLAKICRRVPEREELPSDANNLAVGTEPMKDIDRLDRLSCLLTTYFSTNLTVEQAAQSLFIGTRHLERIMQREYGKSFYRELCDRRLDAAEQMLSNRALSVSHIATTVGFPSRAAFCRAFERRHGLSPTAFRRQREQSLH